MSMQTRRRRDNLRPQCWFIYVIGITNQKIKVFIRIKQASTGR